MISAGSVPAYSRWRGEANPSAKSEAMIEDSYRTMVEDYRRMPEKEKMIRDICQGDPSPCR